MKIDVLYAGSTFDHAADEGVSLSGVVERFAGLRYQGIIFEKIQPCLDGIVKVFRVADFGVILRTGFVTASPRPGPENLASGNGPRFLRKRRAIFL
jgi:hypothetical protein